MVSARSRTSRSSRRITAVPTLPPKAAQALAAIESTPVSEGEAGAPVAARTHESLRSSSDDTGGTCERRRGPGLHGASGCIPCARDAPLGSLHGAAVLHLCGHRARAEDGRLLPEG